jgi:GTPase
VRREGKPYIFVDTAGIRRRARIVDKLEKFSVIKAFQSIDRAQVVIILMDATEPLTDQDVRIAGYAFEKGRALMIVMNKWDLVEKDSNTVKKLIERTREELKFCQFAPVVTISALKGTRAPKLFSLIEDLYEKYTKRVTTAELNKFLEGATKQHPPGTHRNKPIKIYYATQVRVRPPAFTFFCNHPESIHFSYSRYMENRIREAFDFGGSPLRLTFKKRKGDSAFTEMLAQKRSGRGRS